MTANNANNSGMRTILIVLGVLIGLCCLLSLCGFLLLTLMGPAVGDVFSEVVRELSTPVP